MFPGDMIPPCAQEKLESYEDQHVPYTLHGHNSYVDFDEEEDLDSNGEPIFDSETCALADQEPSSHQSS